MEPTTRRIVYSSLFPTFLTFLALSFVVLVLYFSTHAKAGVFSLTQFVDPQEWSLGIEPEVTLSGTSGFAVNTKFTYGLSDLSNLQFGVGPGSGERKFRIGGAYTLDFIPDLEGQLGTGIAVQGYVYKMKGELTQTEFTLVPYVHKGFKLDNGTGVDPYFSVPFGMALLNGNYRGIVQAAVGSFFKLTPNFAYSLELGLNLSNTDSYLAGGVLYTH